jgi:aryl-alcohol dehydrogenase-like predicted oxidoreductase
MKSLGISDQNQWARFIAAQYQYSLVVRDIENEFSDLCVSEGVGIVPWGPLGGGFLTGKYKQGIRPEKASEGRIAVMEEGTEEHWDLRSTPGNWDLLDLMSNLGEKYNCTHSQIAISWLLSQPAVSSVIIGVRTLDQLEDNLGYRDLDITQDDLNKLNEITEPGESYPYRFIRKYANRKE